MGNSTASHAEATPPPPCMPIGAVPGGTVHRRDAPYENGPPFFFHPDEKRAGPTTYVFADAQHQTIGAQLFFLDRRAGARPAELQSPGGSAVEVAAASVAESNRLWAESLGLAERPNDAAERKAAAAAVVAAEKEKANAAVVATTPQQRVKQKRMSAAANFDQELAAAVLQQQQQQPTHSTIE